jgi:two-component system osmolarity sensor histidine kinase EnvZ
MKAMPFIRNLIPRTLLTRFLLIIILPSIIGQLLLVFLFYDKHWSNVSYRVSNLIANQIQLLLSSDDEQISKIEQPLQMSYSYIKSGSLEEVQPRLQEELAILKIVLDSKINRKNLVKIVDDKKIEVSFLMDDGVAKISLSLKLLVNPTSYVFVVWMICLNIILLLISLLFSRRQIKSILELAEAADSFGRNKKLQVQYRPSGAYEIRRAGMAFLKMKERIEKQVSKRMQMLAMISHDLRTPLTRMKLQLELMEDSEEKEEFRHDIETMKQMIDSYLSFARGEEAEEFKKTNLVDWFKTFLQSKWDIYDISFTSKLKNIYAMIRQQSFERAISNILGNAVKYASIVHISINRSASSITITIEDNGTGIKEEEKHLVFKPFYRSDKSRSIDDTGSVGLGLAITKEIILSHNGEIFLEKSSSLGGLMVTIILPLR